MRHGVHRQSGESLVSLMVGLLVSMLVALAMDTVYTASRANLWSA